MSAEANTPSLSLWFLKRMMPDQSMGVAFQLTQSTFSDTNVRLKERRKLRSDPTGRGSFDENKFGIRMVVAQNYKDTYRVTHMTTRQG